MSMLRFLLQLFLLDFDGLTNTCVLAKKETVLNHSIAKSSNILVNRLLLHMALAPLVIVSAGFSLHFVNFSCNLKPQMDNLIRVYWVDQGGCHDNNLYVHLGTSGSRHDQVSWVDLKPYHAVCQKANREKLVPTFATRPAVCKELPGKMWLGPPLSV